MTASQGGFVSVSHLLCVLFFRWHQRNWLCSNQDVHEAQEYRVQTPTVLQVSGSAPGLELDAPLPLLSDCICTAGIPFSREHKKLCTTIGTPARLCPRHWEQHVFSLPQCTRCWKSWERQDVTACSVGWALNAASSHCCSLLSRWLLVWQTYLYFRCLNFVTRFWRNHKCGAASLRAQKVCCQERNFQQKNTEKANFLIPFLQLDCRGNRRGWTHLWAGLHLKNLFL